MQGTLEGDDAPHFDMARPGQKQIKSRTNRIRIIKTRSEMTNEA